MTVKKLNLTVGDFLLHLTVAVAAVVVAIVVTFHYIDIGGGGHDGPLFVSTSPPSIIYEDRWIDGGGPVLFN